MTGLAQNQAFFLHGKNWEICNSPGGLISDKVYFLMQKVLYTPIIAVLISNAFSRSSLFLFSPIPLNQMRTIKWVLTTQHASFDYLS